MTAVPRVGLERGRQPPREVGLVDVAAGDVLAHLGDAGLVGTTVEPGAEDERPERHVVPGAT